MNAVELQTVEPARRADVAQDAIHSARQQWQREHRRPSALTAREALTALQFEAMLVWVAAQNLATGTGLDEEDRARLNLACKRIDAITAEVTG